MRLFTVADAALNSNADPKPAAGVPDDVWSSVARSVVVVVPASVSAIEGVASVGDVPNTAAPVPVSFVNAAARFAEVGVARNVATLEPSPETPLEIGRPVAFVSVAALGVPRSGVTSAGEVAKTAAPLPVSFVSAPARLAEVGVARNVATPEPSPLIPVATGKPVALVSVAADGVPRSGVTRAGDVANTAAPEPVSFVSAAARLAEVGVAKNVAIPEPSPLIPVETGSPVTLVNVPELGVPRTGVTNVGDVAKTSAPVPVSSVSCAAMPAELFVDERTVPLLVTIPVAGTVAAAAQDRTPVPSVERT